MSQKELQRMKVVENAVSGRPKVSEAAKMLQLSERQMTRLKGRVTGDAVDWVYHGNRGRSPSNAISDETREAVVKLALGKYVGFNEAKRASSILTRTMRPRWTIPICRLRRRLCPHRIAFQIPQK